ncbi:hypothetical protein GWK47_007066 [Chionoecetes opilio]|uniref:Uncharacterized protein n=1 Tax=Chionoecetes opilio TaxID=41210 RepID=A0A8J5CT62_CHIOP|nr:hypothetical protein GWK47_007066 [Chionoecetes opilio]
MVLPQIHGVAPGEAHGPGPGCPRLGGEASAGSGIETEPAACSTDGTTPSSCGSLEIKKGRVKYDTDYIRRVKITGYEDHLTPISKHTASALRFCPSRAASITAGHFGSQDRQY